MLIDAHWKIDCGRQVFAGCLICIRLSALAGVRVGLGVKPALIIGSAFCLIIRLLSAGLFPRTHTHTDSDEALRCCTVKS